MTARTPKRAAQLGVTSDDPVDRLFAGMVLHAELRRGATKQDMISLAVRYKRLDIVKALMRP